MESTHNSVKRYINLCLERVITIRADVDTSVNVKLAVLLISLILFAGLEVDDSFVEWAKQQLQDAGNESKRPRVLNQQSVWIGTNTGSVYSQVYYS